MNLNALSCTFKVTCMRNRSLNYCENKFINNEIQMVRFYIGFGRLDQLGLCPV